MASSQDSSSGSAEMVKPNSTITVRQDKLLDEMAASRFASRSEALRTAIENLHNSIEGDGDERLLNLITQVKSVSSELGEVTEQVEELHSVIITQATKNSGSPTRDGPDESGTSDSEQLAEDDEIDDQVYAAVTTLGNATEQAVADETSYRPLEVHKSLERLLERGWITTVDDKEETEYEPAPASN